MCLRMFFSINRSGVMVFGFSIARHGFIVFVRGLILNDRNIGRVKETLLINFSFDVKHDLVSEGRNVSLLLGFIRSV